MEKEIRRFLKSYPEVKMSRELNWAKYKLSALALDILYLMIAQVRKNDQEFFEYQVTHAQLEESLGKSIQRSSLKKIPGEIMSNPFTLKKNNWETPENWCSILHYCKVNHVFVFKLNPSLKDLIITTKKDFNNSRCK